MVESKHKWKAWLYLAPALVLLAIFTVYPIFNTIRIAFLDGYQSLAAINGASYSFGIANFEKVVGYSKFLDTLKTTALLCVITVPISTILALLIAVTLNSIKPLRRVLQTIYFLPYVTNSIAIGMVFATMFNMVGNGFGTDNEIIYTAGVINNLIEAFGGKPVNWVNVGSTDEANMFVMCVYIIWNALPFKILILLGALQSVNKQYYDAAKIDGTSKFRTLTRITVPLLSPMITYVVITGFMGGFKEYSSVVGVFGDKLGPPGENYKLNTIVGMVQRALESGKTGEASAAALILFAIIMAVTFINLRISKKSTHY